jgi:hypothetical protein
MAWATPKTWSDSDSAAVTLAAMNTAVRDILAPTMMIDVDVFAQAKANTNWSTLNIDVADARIYHCARESTGVQNAEVSWDVFIPAGTWRWDLVYNKNTDIGIYSLYFNGVIQATIDGYNGSLSNNQAGSATGIVIGSSTTVEVKIVMATKNASSSAYYGSIGALRFRRTDTPASPRTWAAGVQKKSDLNAYVRDLACAPVLLDVDVFLPATANTTWSTITVDSGDNLVHNGTKDSGGAQNSEISWDLIIPAGTWRIDVMHRKGSDRGVYSVQIDAVEQGTIDGYAAATAYNQTGSVTGIAVATTDKHTLKLKMATKNASSSSYVGSIQQVRMRRTDSPTAPKTWAINDESTGALFNTHIRNNSAPAVIVDIDLFAAPKSSTTWSTIAINAGRIYQADLDSTGAQNAALTWDVWLTAGTWRIDVMHVVGTDRGIYTVSLDGVTAGTIDGYSVSHLLPNQLGAITGIAVATTKVYELKVLMATKNASSSNYYGAIQKIRLRRTDI